MGGGGDRIRAIDYIPALRNYNFDNRIGSCCFTGTWLLYGEENYNSYNTGAANWWAYGDNYCLDVPAAFDNQASSLRFTRRRFTPSTTRVAWPGGPGEAAGLQVFLCRTELRDL